MVAHVGMGVRKVAKRIQFRRDFTIGVEEHQIQRVLPVLQERGRKFGMLVGVHFQLIDEHPSAHELVVDHLDDLVIGEQTCSQVSAAGSTALVIEGSPQDDCEHGLFLFGSDRQSLMPRNPMNLGERVER